jgi:hypothetical protein
MPLDPSIILGVKPPQINSPQETQAQQLQLQNLKLEGQSRQAQIQEQQALAQDRQLQAAARVKQQAGQDALAAAIKKYTQNDPQTGAHDLDYQAVAADVGAAGFPTEANAWLKMQSDNADNLQKLTTAHRAYLTQQFETLGGLAGTAQSGDDFTAGVALAAAHGLIDEGTARQVLNQVQAAGPDAWKAVADHYKQLAPSYQKTQTPEAQATLAKTQAEAAKAKAEADNLAKFGSTTPPVLRTERVLLDGVPAIVNMNPRTGLYTKPGSTEDVSARVKPIPPVAAGGAADAVSNAKEQVAGMMDGTLPPVMPGRQTKEYSEIMAEAHRQGYNLQAAVTDWNATQKHITTLNNAQQLRLNQSINALPDLLDSVDALASKWKGGRFPILNKANLALAKGGAYGTDVATVANQLDAQIADVVSDLGVVYMGGNSPTDHALDLAGKSLKGEWNAKVLHDMVTMAKSNVRIRKNSIATTGVQGASANNPYAPPQPAAAAPADLVWNPQTKSFTKPGAK